MGQSAKVKVAGQTPMDQVVNATKMAVNNGQKEMTLQLNPDNMGQVRINLVSTANGQLHARFVASTQETQQELNAKVEQLRASLEKQGVNVGQITVIAAGETGAGNQNGNQNANQQAQNDLFRQPEGNVNPNQQGQGGQSQTQQQSNATGNPIPNSRQNNASTGQGSESQPSETNPPEQNMRDKNMRDGSRVSVLI
jgi:flagellar hook-length control protein FliK